MNRRPNKARLPKSALTRCRGSARSLSGTKRKALLLVSVVATISACTALPGPELPVRVFNLSQGLARQDPGGRWAIYAKGNRFAYETNGVCIAKGESRPCMWHAVAFEFSATEESTALECTAVFSAPTDVVDPVALRAANTKNHTFTTELRGRRGQAFWPGYTIRDDSTVSRNTTVVCRSKGRTVLSYSYSITEPPSNPLAPTP